MILLVALIMLLAVISTATYAWYSANNVVSGGDILFQSSASDAAGVLTIGKTTNATSAEITFDEPGALNPMIPLYEGVIGTTTYTQFRSFVRTFEDLDEMGRWVARLDGVAETPYTLSLDGQEYFYINNTDTLNPVTVEVDYVILGELADKLNVALFVGEEPVLLGIMSGSDSIHYGSITAGQPVSDALVMSGAYKATGEMKLTVPAGGSVCLRLIVWLDGVKMHNDDGGVTTSFSLNFKGV